MEASIDNAETRIPKRPIAAAPIGQSGVPMAGRAGDGADFVGFALLMKAPLLGRHRWNQSIDPIASENGGQTGTQRLYVLGEV